jgi:hypothetical protein
LREVEQRLRVADRLAACMVARVLHHRCIFRPLQ